MTRNVHSPMLYRAETPSRWLRAAVSALDEQLASFRLAQWQRVQPIPVSIVVPLPPRREARR